MDKENNSKTIYLDNAATTFPKPESVYTEMDYVNRNLAVNTGRGSYSLARKATEIIDRTREKALKLIKGKDVADIVLTPSATIAMNVIIGGLDWSGADVCYVSPFEHNAVMRPLHLISEKYGFDLIELPLKSETLEIDFEKMEYMFSMNPPTKVFATHVSNVTGYILPVKEITEMAKKYNSKVIIDASQSLGLLDINMNNLMADFIAFAGHKNLYGPFGTSGFFVRKGTKINPFIAGGTGSDSLNLNMPKTIPTVSSNTFKPIFSISSFRYSTASLASFVNGSLVQPFPGVAVNFFKLSKFVAILPVIFSIDICILPSLPLRFTYFCVINKPQLITQSQL